jgi:MFS family permease
MTTAALSAATGRANSNRERMRVLWVACGAHALHDGLTDTLYLLLPLWQAQFALSYAAIGMLRALYTGAMAGFQVPAAKMAHRTGGARMLAGGTVWPQLLICFLEQARASLCLLSPSFSAGSARAPSTRSHQAWLPQLTRDHARAARSALTTSPAISERAPPALAPFGPDRP